VKQSTAAPDAARLQGARWPSAPELLAVFDGSSVMTGPARARRSEADVARRGVDWLGVSGGGTVAAAIVRRAEMLVPQKIERLYARTPKHAAA